MSDAAKADPGKRAFSSLGRTLVLSVALPFVLIQVLLHAGMTPQMVLVLATISPFVEIAIELVRTKRIGFIAIVSLVGLLTGFALTGLTGNSVFMILKDSAFTFIFGALFLVSLLSAQPLIFRLNLDMAGSNAEARAASAALWEKPAVRRSFRIMTAVWGLGLVADAVVRAVVSLTLPLATATSLSPLISVVAIGGLFLWTMLYVRFMRRRAAAVAASLAAA